MKATLITVGIILLIIGVIGIIYNYATVWMWVLAVVGLAGLIWGLVTKNDQAMM